MMSQPGICMRVRAEASSVGMRERARKRLKTMAPAMMSSIMQELRMVSISERLSILQLRLLRQAAMTRLPKAPTEAASVGVNQPRNMPPMTAIKRSRGSMTPSSEWSFSCQDEGGEAGPSCGLRMHFQVM